MKDIKELRNNINAIDEQMAKLFEERMQNVKEVALYKKENSLPVFDGKREQEIIAKNINYINDKEIKEYYVNYLKDVIDISKKYQNDLLEGLKIAYCGVEGIWE